MRLGYLCLSLLAPLSSFARTAGRSHYTPSPSPSHISEEDADDTIQGFNLSPRDRQAVFGDTTIIKRLKVTDCHSSIAKQLEGRCRSEKAQVEPNEAYRSDLAISLTLCSLASAMQTIPSDCDAWYRSNTGRDTPGWRIWWNVPDMKSASARSACLGALHRSPQDWTSYNQYLSDATLLCSALRADWQMNQARELYANATMEKISLISLIRTNEHERRDERRDDQIRLTQDMSDGVKAARRNAEAVSDILDSIQQERSHQEANRISTEKQIREAMEALTTAGEGVWDGIRIEGAEITMSLVQGMRDSHVDIVKTLSQQLRASLSSLATEHVNAMDYHHQRLGSDTDLMIARLADTFALLAGDTKDHLDAFTDKLAETSSEAAILNGNVVAAAKLIRDLHPALLSSAQSALAIQDHHNQTLASLLQSRDTATELSEELGRSLEAIGQTLALARQSSSGSGWALFSPSLFSVSAFTIPESALHGCGLLGFVTRTIIGILEVALGVIGYTVQLLGVSLAIIVSISTTFYAAVHSRAWRPIRRFLRRIDSQLNLIADDFTEQDIPLAGPPPKAARILSPITRPTRALKQPVTVKQEIDQDIETALPIFDDFVSKSKIASRSGKNNRLSGHPIAPSPRIRGSSAPPDLVRR